MIDDIITGILLIFFASVIYLAGRGRMFEIVPLMWDEKRRELSNSGFWEHNGDCITCSECRKEWNIRDNDTETFDYCPGCGRKMDGEVF